MNPRVSDEETISFGEFELQLKSGELRKNGNVVRLQPQPFKLLVFLASHAGQTVTRQELQQAVWADETFVDFEHGLNYCIKQIRSALGDSAQSPRLIETLPRRGYRFIAEVEKLNGSGLVESTSSELEVESATGNARPPAVQSSTKRLAIIGALAIAFVLAGYFAWRSVNRSGVPISKVMMAVLPFENLSGDTEQDYFSDGMTEEMIARLGRIQPQRLGVIARTSTMTYKRATKDIAHIGRELGVQFVVEGSVRREQDRVRITAQLIRVNDQTHLWSQSYDRPTGDALNVQSEVADRIANSLAIELLGEGEKRVDSSNAASAVDAYLRGRYLWNKGDRNSVRKSLEYFDRAIEIDPNYADGYAGLADSYRLLGMYYVILPVEAYPKAKEAALRALRLDPANAVARVSLGTIKFRYEWNWEEAEHEFLRAIEINPSLAIAHHDYAWFLVAMERFDEGIEHMKVAQRLDPLSPLANSDVGWVYLMARRYDEAVDQINRTLELEPAFGGALACLERAYTLKGQHREALETLLREIGDGSGPPGDDDPVQSMRSLYQTRLERRLEQTESDRSSPYNIATMCVAAGEREKACEWLARAFTERDPMLVGARTDPALDLLRGDERFESLLRRVGLAK